jgi:phage portal protein BeeE
MWWPFRREQKIEQRASASGFTAEILSARESYISGRSGLGELTATVQSCVSLWENGLSMSDVSGTDLLDRRTLAMIGRSLALRGEALFLIDDRGLIPCSDWDLNTKNGRPVAYRISISEAGGGTTQTALAGEVLHVRVGADVVTPWLGQSPLRRASLTAGLLHALEAALSEVFENAPIGSLIVPFPESTDVDLETLGRGFRGRRGRVLLRESVNVSAAGGPAPNFDWKAADLTPDLGRAMPLAALEMARGAICGAFGVLPSLWDKAATGPQTREAQRHLAQWTLQPVAEVIAEEVADKIGGPVSIDMMTATQSFDAGGSARAFATLIEGLARAKEAGLDPAAIAGALAKLDWTDTRQ